MLRAIWQWLTTTRYTRALEAEVARLRAENRALLNSLLGTAGFPPVEAPEHTPLPVSRLRRRSWQQMAMARELEAARQAAASPAVADTTSGRISAPARGPFH